MMDELYEKAAQNLAKTLEAQKVSGRKVSALSEVDDNCFDYSRPGINSSRNASKALEKAIESLSTVPEHVEARVRKDKRFEPVVMSQATRTLNVPRTVKVYKDLIPVDPNIEIATEAERNLQEEIKKSIEAVRQPSRVRDPEPRLEDIQINSYTRMRPSVVQPPPKPTSGVAIQTNYDFEAIQSENRLRAESNRLD